MGMELKAHWECERCDESADAKMGSIPEGWLWAGRGALWVDAQDYHVDYKLPQDKYILCDKCAKSFIRWVEVNTSKDANAEQASSTAPVVSPSVSAGVSDKEKNLVKGEGNRTHAMEDIVPDEELPERNCERDFPHDPHPFIDDANKEYGCPGIKNIDVGEDLV